MKPVFNPPIGGQALTGSVRRSHSARTKRKRRDAHDGEQEHQDDELLDRNKRLPGSVNLEYSAVVTPLERHQHRIAGLPLDQHPPSFPFPHSQVSSTHRQDRVRTELSGVAREEPRDAPQSLHFQHLGALTAVVHRSLLNEDFARASRALGLMFRDASVRRSTAPRSQGYMGIAAEVLLRRGSAKPNSSNASPFIAFTREGFGNAMRFYERLIVKHPYHKSWPGSTNAVDFYLAMFNVWVYVVYSEHSSYAQALTRSGEEAEMDGADMPIDNKVRELEEAKTIASRMDTCLANLPYKDEPELIRLRAMVALWIADLHGDILNSRQNHVESASDGYSGKSLQSLSPREAQGWTEDHSYEAVKARDVAEELLARLRNHTGPGEDGSE
ncbi:hypothetical protein PV08_00462 [Exophiala spinifera]|uniref:Transcription factor domain-containing protein n=1 Tax=Exophiala spinifera TaxID=91928 RepID=A0A0D2A4Z3_9EURO|nr:uncharacterized protein PV08_00462 [Exophiala spinifera]KIW19887.1 hypothetical protein PV08_00462 [Exophiala spinifera]